jgi:glycine cleavage system H protein
MKKDNTPKRDLYYTKDHEWVDFQGSVAYVGVCAFKLTGFKEVEEIVQHDLSGFKKQGETIATIRYIDYQVDVHMPVDGKILEVNDVLTDNRNLLLQQPENNGWIVLIIPAQPYERKGLLLPKEYQMNGKSKYAKS